MKTAIQILEMFKNAPSVARWAADKTNVIKEEATPDFPYNSVKHVFSGEFKNSNSLSNHLEQIEADGSEFMLSVSVTKPKYKGEKAHVSVMIAEYFDA